MKLDLLTLLICLIGIAIHAAILYFIIKAAVEKALIHKQEGFTNTLVESNRQTLKLMERQNKLLNILITDEEEDRTFALVNKTTGAVKMVKVGELSNHNLDEYDCTLIKKQSVEA